LKSLRKANTRDATDRMLNKDIFTLVVAVYCLQSCKMISHYKNMSRNECIGIEIKELKQERMDSYTK
jgi:hypothetical protein